MSSRSEANTSLPSCSHVGFVSLRTLEMMILRMEPPVEVIVQISKRLPPLARRAKAIVPFEAHAASVLRSCVVVRRVLPFPLGCMVQMSSCPPGPFDHAIRFVAEGDQVGATSSFESVVSRCSPDPSG